MELAGYVPIDRRARQAVIALVIVAAAEIVTIASDVVALPWLDDEKDIDAANRFDTVTGIAGFLEFATLVIAAVYFIRWFNAVHRNLDGLCPGVRRHATWWSIGGWFIPVMGLFRPKQILNGMLACGVRESRQPWWAPVWWGMFLLASIVGNVDGRLFADADTFDEIRRSTTIDAVASAIFLAATPLAIILVRRVTEAMEAKRGSIPADAVPVAS